MKVKTDVKEYDGCYLVLGRYQYDGSFCIKVWSDHDGPIATITKCLVDETLGKYDAYVDTNNCPWVLDFIEEYKLGEKTPRVGHSGYCTYPLVRFDYNECIKYQWTL